MSETKHTISPACHGNPEKHLLSEETTNALYALTGGLSLTGLLLALGNATEQMTPDIDWMDLVDLSDGMPWVGFAWLVATALASYQCCMARQRATQCSAKHNPRN